MFRVFAGFLSGAWAVVAVYVVVQWQGMKTVCGPQEGAVCIQQWLTATLPAAALALAVYGSIQIGKQVRQGQASVDTNEMNRLSGQYDVLTSLRDEFLERQRLIEKLDRDYPRHDTLPTGTTWDDLEQVQYHFDGFVEEIADAKREPYLFEYQEELDYFRRKAFARSEVYRTRAERWRQGTLWEEPMARCLHVTKALSIRDMILVRTSLDALIRTIGERASAIAKADPALKKMVFPHTDPIRKVRARPLTPASSLRPLDFPSR